MRRLIIAIPILLCAAGAGVAGWHYLRPRDPLAEARQLLAKGDVRAAELVLRSAVQAHPERAEAHFRLGQLQLQLGDAVAAEHELRAAGEHGWDAAALRPLLARAVVSQGRNEEVLRDYSADGLPADDAAAVLVARAQAQLRLGRPAEAAASVAEAQRLAPKSVEPAMAAARLAMVEHDPAGAERHVDQALVIDPHDLLALSLRAQLQAMRDDPAALASYSAAIDQARAAAMPGAADELRIGRARVLLATNDDKAARTDLDAVLATQPKQPMAQYLSALLYVRSGNWKAADAALDAVGPVLPRMPQGDLTLALVKANLGQPEQAIEAAERQVARTPEDPGAVKLLAKLYLAQKQPARAAGVLAAAAAGGHKLDAEGLGLLSTAYAGVGQPAQAVAALRQAVVLNPDDAQLLTRVAALELRQGDAPLAERTLQHALDVTPAALTTTPAAATAPSPAGTADGSAQARTAAALVITALKAGDVDQAAAALERMKQAGGDPEQIALLSGNVKVAQMDLDGARAAFEEAARISPDAAAPRIELARLLAMQGHTDDAIARLDAILAGDHANMAALTALVNVELTADQPDKAVATVEAAHKASPDNPGLVGLLGALYIQTGHPQQALDLLDAGYKPGASAPANAEMLRLRAQAQLSLGQDGAAAQTLRPLLDQSPDDVTLRRQIVELLAADKKYDDARVLLREGLGRRPGDATLLATDVAVAQREGGPDAALARIAVLARDPANAAVLVMKGDLLVSQHRFADAAAAYLAVQASLPKDDRGTGLLQIKAAQAVAAGGDAGRATAMLRDWLAAHPTNADVALSLASLDITANRLAEAHARLDIVLASQPNNPVALNNLAWVEQLQGHLTRADALATRGYLLRSSPQSADTLGWILLAQGRAADALALLREAARAAPGDPAIHYHLAAALARDGQRDAAVAVLKPLVDKPGAGFDDKPAAAKLLAELSP